MQTNALHELSVQNIVICSRLATGSCGGGSSSLTYDWIIHANGGSICTEASPPYVSVNGVAPSCKQFDDPSFSCEKPELGPAFYEGQACPASYVDHELLIVGYRTRTGVPVWKVKVRMAICTSSAVSTAASSVRVALRATRGTRASPTTLRRTCAALPLARGSRSRVRRSR